MKRFFEILDDMNQSDTEKGTATVGVVNSFVSANKVKAGAHITMGAPEQAIWDIESGKVIPILLLVDAEDYFQRKNHETHP